MDNTSGLHVPRTFNGMTAMEDPEIGSITNKLRFGDSALGWPGDAGLQIFLGPYYDQTGREVGTSWQVWHFGKGEPYCFMRAKPGTHLDERLIIRIMEHDTRFHDLAREIKANQEKIERELELKHREQTQIMRENIAREVSRTNRRQYFTR